MSAEIVTPFGIHAAQIPNDDVIARIEWLLERAKAGEIVGIAWGAARPNGATWYGATAGTANANVLIAAASQAWFDLLKSVDGAEQ